MSGSSLPERNSSQVSLAQATGLPLNRIQVFCPIPLVTHPMGTEEIDAAATGWAVEQGLYPAGSLPTRMNIGFLIGAGMPFLTDDRVIPFTCYNQWGIPWDDHLDRLATVPGALAPHVGEVFRAMCEPAVVPIPDDPWVAAPREACRLLSRVITPQALADFTRTNATWFFGQLWKYGLVKRPVPPTLAEYLRMRWAKTGIEVLLGFTAPGGGYALTPEDLADPLVRAFTKSVFYPLLIFNDLVSLAKEAPAGHAEVNIIAALRREHGIDTGEAFGRAWDLTERITILMLRLREQLRADPRPGVARYAAELPQWLPATLHWTANSARYLEADELAAHGPVTAPALELVDAPTRWDPEDLTPPPYPDIAWWWDQLRH